MTGEGRTVSDADGMTGLFDHVVEGFIEGFRQSEAPLAGTIFASESIQPTSVHDLQLSAGDEPE